MINLAHVMHRFAEIVVQSGDLEVPRNSVNFDTILSFVFGLAGAIAVLVIAVAGFQYVISRGDPAATAKAKNAIIYAVIGLMVVIAAFTIVNFVGSRV